MSDGDIRNRYQVRITNKAADDVTFRISARGIPEDALDLGNFREVKVRPGHSTLVQASVRLPPELAARTEYFELLIEPLGKPAEARAEKVRFDTPQRRP
jgi:hypothetical protein